MTVSAELPEPHALLTNRQIDSSLTDRISRFREIPLAELMELKRNVESELDKLYTTLHDQGIGMDTPLITPNGFPRADIDVLEVRLVRRNINMLKNDLNNLMERLHALLNAHFSNDQNAAGGSQLREDAMDIDYTVPFALITEIAPNGPVHLAGINNGDKLISCGVIHAANHSRLKNLQNEVINNENKTLKIRILSTNQQIMDLQLTPTRNWNGRGLLGCRLQEL
ncbi:Nas2p KNAG_0E03540 [Huiozyma naganishii CBS 8797]|uniref:Probable 26S proteasome regulatory subunit p27 n=1 Tax=Huiozyma naganishii (strain ATCC MYA-139 / BCRC 22969 / CBS 8797 / KCTC 17520 / NBRC 10181 / NCYC 3082 / Yp74L-3) TaxID=1071383 RepID=J7S805_HUIN7|nr:hypothetical protein KNAG_0E03540 [Kazachstania naganishii CBS 8797]CCK70611.1 hypothetical protein KNAG_0E03540 [Kazachstania naganishii CBS 8797]